MTWLYLPPWGARVVTTVAVGLVLVLALQMIREWRGFAWRRRLGPLALRLAVIGGLVFVLLNPSILLPREATGKPRLLVLVDTSASMATKDVNSQSRLAAALATLNQPATRAALDHDFQVTVQRFDRDARPATLDGLTAADARGDGSDLAGAVNRAVAELSTAKSPAGVLVVSDGRATTAGAADAARLALAGSVPLWIYGVGGAVERHDLWLETAAAEVLAFAGADVELAATLRVAGYSHRSFPVQLLQDDKVLQTREVVPDESGRARVTATVHAPASGEHRYLFRVAPDPLEADTQNNERAVFVRVVGEKVRVLVVEGQPHWDTKFLVQTLTRSPHVELTAVYQVGPNRHLAILAAKGAEQRVETDLFPRTAREFNAYDVIVLGRGCEAFFDGNTERLLGEFLSVRGGNVVFARGKPYGGGFAPLARLEPVVWSGNLERDVRLEPTEAARETALFNFGSADSLEETLAQLPVLDGAALTRGEKPLAVVLATGRRENESGSLAPTRVMAYQRYGQGKVLTLNATGLWRWAFGDPSRSRLETVYEQFWLSLLRWLLAGSDFLPGTDVALRSARRVYTTEQPLEFFVATKALDPQAYRPRLIISNAVTTVEIEPRPAPSGGGYLAQAGPLAPGSYQVTLHSNLGQPRELTQTIDVVASSVEKQDLSADPGTLADLARISGGQSLRATDVARLGDLVRRWQSTQQLAEQRATIWDRGGLLAAILTALAIEWYLRRREGLL